MKNQRERFIPAPPEGPKAGSMPGKLEAAASGKNAKKLSEKPDMPDVGFTGFKMVENMKNQLWEHHEKHHLDANGEFKPHLVEKGMKLMKKFMK